MLSMDTSRRPTAKDVSLECTAGRQAVELDAQPGKEVTMKIGNESLVAKEEMEQLRTYVEAEEKMRAAETRGSELSYRTIAATSGKASPQNNEDGEETWM